MSKISLRAYNKEIESLIDRGVTDEAVVHCRYILQTYPKCISTYRNLAKALLESKQYAEAEDIFNRVLSVYPDDFVSHIGLSIIKENQGNLDAAIWHMELAYDVQPSNPALTAELRRLFGRRDGVQPPKIRLTRGALIRMYARGELYQQAIAEIQSTLAADSKRIDLHVLLADMYYFSGALAEASETCQELLSSLPYCFEANQLMMQIIPRTSKADSARMHRDRLAELDPYYAFITTPDTLSDEIPEDQVLLDHFSGEGSSYIENQGLPKTSEADWEKITEAEKLYSIEEVPEDEDSAIASITTEEIPDDILEASITRSLKAGEGDELTTAPLKTADETNIPDWMRSAGWIPATHSEQELLDNSDTSTENISNEIEDIQPGELPEWLHKTAPEAKAQDDSEKSSDLEPSSNEPDEPDESEFEVPETVGSVVATQAQESAVNAEDSKPEPLAEQTKPEQGETGDMMPTDSSTNNENEWLNQFRNDSPNKGEENDLPDWLKDFESEKEQLAEENMDIPEWLKSLEPTDSSAETSPAVVGSSKFKNDVFPKEADDESPVLGKSFLSTKDLTNEELEAGKNDTAYIAPDDQSSPFDWEAPKEQAAEGEAESPVASMSQATPDEIESAIDSTGFTFTKPLTEEEVHSGKLDSTYLPPEAHPLPTDWESSMEKAPEPAEQPAREIHSPLPAWIKNVLKPAASAQPAPEEAEPVAPPPVPAPVQPVTARPSILDQLTKAEAPADADKPEETTPAVEPVAEGLTPEPEAAVMTEAAQTPPSPTADELGEEPLQDLVTGPQESGAITDETNNELLEWLRGFKGSEEQIEEGQPSEVEATSAAEEGISLERLEEFAQPEAEEAVTGVSEAAETEGVDKVVESLHETVILPDETETPSQTPAAVEPSVSQQEPPVIEPESIPAPVQESGSEVEPEETFEPIPESKISEFFVEQVEPSAEQPSPESAEPVAPETAEPVMEKPSAPEPALAPEEAVSQPVEPEIAQAIPEPVESRLEEILPHEIVTPEPVAEQPVSEPVVEAAIPEPVEEAAIPEPVSEAAQPEPVPASKELPKTSPVVPDPLRVANSALSSGDMALALNEYTLALHDESNLPSVIVALKSAVEQHGAEVELWQLLGDAYAHSNRFDEAFSAYDKAETLLLDLTK